MPTLTSHIPVPRPSYTQARENLVKAIPPKILCLLACGGKDCRYEGPECWKANQQVIRGLFSSWWDFLSVNSTTIGQHRHPTSTCRSQPPSTRRVTDDIVAMARPSSHLIEKYSIIEQFRRWSLFIIAARPSGVFTGLEPFFFSRLNIRSVINMQLPGEHAHCGPSLDPGSGFTYTPQIFMDNDSKIFLFHQSHVCNLKYQHPIKCSCVGIFLYFQYTFTTLGCQITEFRPSLASSTEWKFWPSQWEKGGWPYTAMLVWAGQVPWPLRSPRVNAPVRFQCVLCVFPCQASWSPATWSTLSASAPVRPSTTCGSNDLAPSRPGRRSTRCSASLVCWARSWSSTPTWACGMAPHSPCSTTWIDRRCCCTAGRDARSDTRQRSGLGTSAVSVNTAGWAAERSLPTPQVVYLLCVRLSCLALGVPAPPEVHVELEKRSTVKALNRMVRETLVTKHYLPLLNESSKSSWVGSVTSWDDPLGCLERRRELLANKRSFSDSDLSKLEMQKVWLSHYRFRCVNGKPEQPHIIFLFYFLLKDTGWSPYGSPTMRRHWCMQDLIRTNLKPASSIGATLSPDNQTRKKHPHPMNIQMSSTRAGRWSKSSKCAFKKPLHKHSSSLEVTLSLAVLTSSLGCALLCDLCHMQLCRNPHHPNSTSVARLVAKALADQGPHGETVLQRSALLQVTCARPVSHKDGLNLTI